MLAALFHKLAFVCLVATDGVAGWSAPSPDTRRNTNVENDATSLPSHLNEAAEKERNELLDFARELLRKLRAHDIPSARSALDSLVVERPHGVLHLQPAPSPDAADPYRRRLSTALVDLGSSGCTNSAPCANNCEGDCDSDAQCASGLVCFQRSGTTAVPGCTGIGTTNWDYCILLSPPPSPSSPPLLPPSPTPAPPAPPAPPEPKAPPPVPPSSPPSAPLRSARTGVCGLGLGSGGCSALGERQNGGGEALSSIW
jgi:hypothetical protein